jgi:hypothetical protein
VPKDVPLAIIFFFRRISHVQRGAFADMTVPVGDSLMTGLSIPPVCAEACPLASYKKRPQHWGAKLRPSSEKSQTYRGTPGTIP